MPSIEGSDKEGVFVFKTVRDVEEMRRPRLVAAAAGGRVLMTGCGGTPPKEGRTVFDALRDLGVPPPTSIREAGRSFEEHGFAALGAEHYLPELRRLPGLRREMVRRTVLNVVEKLVSLRVSGTERPRTEPCWPPWRAKTARQKP